MLRQALQHLRTPAPDWAKRMGYLHELVAIDTRARRLSTTWAPHLDRSRAAVLACAREAARKRRAVIVGSGLWLDVPVDELCGMFDEVVLVDVAHLPAQRRRARGHANLVLSVADVTGVAEAVLETDPGDPLPLSRPDLFADQPVDFVASVNMLSQLPVLPRRWLEAADAWDQEILDAFCRQILTAHRSWLSHLAPQRCLISDVSRCAFNSAGEEVERRDTCYGAAPSQPEDTWRWDLAPAPEQDPHHDIVLDVALWTR